MKWGLFAVVPALLLAGCAGNVDSPRFKSADEFFGYMDGLKLNKMSITAASNRLAGEGYTCSASGVETTCSNTEKMLLCKDKTSVTLKPYDKHQISVKEKYWTLCI